MATIDWLNDHINQVICGDAMKVLEQLPNESIDFVFTDPPYGHNNNNGDLIHRREEALGRGTAGAARAIANDGVEANELFKSILPELNRVLHKGDCCCCCGGGGGPDPQFARWSLWLDEIFDFKQMIVWDKGKMGMGWHYRRSYETVLVSVKRGDGAGRWYDQSKKVENIIRPGDYGIRKIIPSAAQHPTEKPIELAMHFIKLHTQPGDIVLDPFAGHGSTLVAARQMGRRYIGIELDPNHCRIAERRLNATTVMMKEILACL
jgi:DNA modification methylase